MCRPFSTLALKAPFSPKMSIASLLSSLSWKPPGKVLFPLPGSMLLIVLRMALFETV